MLTGALGSAIFLVDLGGGHWDVLDLEACCFQAALLAVFAATFVGLSFW